MNVEFKLKDFTPLIDQIAKEKDSKGKPFGLMGAAAYGVVYRHCTMKRKVCDASIETMADLLGVSARHLTRWIKELCRLGYIEDLTPDIKGKPHTYRVTGKAIIKGEISAQTYDIESEVGENEAGQPMTQSPRTYDTESEVKPKPMTQSHTSKQHETSKQQHRVVVDKKLSDRLERLGILKTVHAELANLPHVTTAYLDSWIKYLDRQPRPPGGGFFVQQIRSGAKPLEPESVKMSSNYDPETLAALRATQAKINQEKRELSHV